MPEISQKAAIAAIDNEKDFRDYLAEFLKVSAKIDRADTQIAERSSVLLHA